MAARRLPESPEFHGAGGDRFRRGAGGFAVVLASGCQTT